MTELEYLDKFEDDQLRPLWEFAIEARDQAQFAVNQITTIRMALDKRKMELLQTAAKDAGIEV